MITSIDMAINKSWKTNKTISRPTTTIFVHKICWIHRHFVFFQDYHWPQQSTVSFRGFWKLYAARVDSLGILLYHSIQVNSRKFNKLACPSQRRGLLITPLSLISPIIVALLWKFDLKSFARKYRRFSFKMKIQGLVCNIHFRVKWVLNCKKNCSK